MTQEAERDQFYHVQPASVVFSQSRFWFFSQPCFNATTIA